MSNENENATFDQQKRTDENTQLSEETLNNVSGGLNEKELDKVSGGIVVGSRGSGGFGKLFF